MTSNPDQEPDDPSTLPPDRHDPYAALRIRDFRLFVFGAFIANLGIQMQLTALRWEIYERTGEALNLGLVGLAEYLPILILVIPAGHLADRLDRRRILFFSYLAMGCCSLGLAYVSYTHAEIIWVYVLLIVIGCARAFAHPARAALVPMLVPREQFSNAVTWSTSSYHLACIMGPAAGGFLVAAFGGAMRVFLIDAIAAMSFCILLLMIRCQMPVRVLQSMSLKSLAAGFTFVYRTRMVLGAITLDMFAVLLGGAVALLPIYAKDILKVGPTGLGLLQSAPAFGALCMAIILAHRPPLKKAGTALFLSVAGFGIATIIFGLSRNFMLSLLMLFLTGFLDNISVVIRHTLVQLSTPDELRGRVSAINFLFIGASNELGGFESGVVAHWFGATISVVSGGVGTLLVVALTAILFPQLRRYRRLGSDPDPAESLPSAKPATTPTQ